MRLYATTTAPPLIVLRTRTVPVALSPEDVEEFVAAVGRFSSGVAIFHRGNEPDWAAKAQREDRKRSDR